jgi:putative ABC transport system permease protein
VPALFVLAAGLLALRLYPWFVRGVYAVGRRWWPPSLYATMIQVGRSSVQYQFIMVFLILTVATGLFSASAARTINQNSEDKLRYLGGSDIKLQVQWENDAPPPGASDDPSEGGSGGGDGGGDASAGLFTKQKVQFSEPPFQPFAQLPGVQSAAKVFVKEDAYVAAGKSNGSATIMGIDTDMFGQVAWLRSGLLDHSFYDYLNLLASDPSAVLVSRSVADDFNVKPGDHVTIGWSDVEGAEFNVYGIIDYWPGWNPNPVLTATSTTTSKNAKAKPKLPHLVVGHLSSIQTDLALEPYDVWLKLKPGASTKELYDAIEQQKLPITKLDNTRQAIVESKNEPFRLAVNGVMTLGFVVSMTISFIGFLLYWVLSLSGRTLQFGILRAMGISFGQLLGMLVAEQALTSGAAIAIGAGAGLLSSRLYVPMFQLSFDTVTQVPPFRVTFELSDSLRLFAIVGTMVAIGLILLGVLLSRIRIHQAVKLGED